MTAELAASVTSRGTIIGQVNDASEGITIIGRINDASTKLKATIVKSIGNAATYNGEYTVTPTSAEQELNTKNKLMANNVTILAIPYFETSNESGITVYIGG